MEIPINNTTFNQRAKKNKKHIRISVHEIVMLTTSVLLSKYHQIKFGNVIDCLHKMSKYKSRSFVALECFD